MKLNIASVAILTIGVAVSPTAPRTVSAQITSAQIASLAGRWMLNREASQFAPEIGFTPNWFTQASRAAADPGGGGGRGRRGGGGSGYIPSIESEEDTKRTRQLTADARNPSVHLTIAETADAITITDDSGEALTFSLDGRHQVLQLGGLSVGATARRVAGHFEVVYEVERDRTIRYNYSRVTPQRIVVEVQFVDRGKLGDHATRMYDAADAETAKPPAPSAPEHPAETFAQEPGAELKGIKKIGLVIDASGPQAVACGLNQADIEMTLSKRLADAGLSVRLNADEDTYVYINVMTSHAPNDLCVSRYDVFLYTHTTASLSYHTTPVLVQVSLLHEGGLAGGPAATHPAAVQRGLEQYLDLCTTRITDANRPSPR
jgi:hypothetical protein